MDAVDMVRQSVRDYAIQHLKPHTSHWDEEQIFPLETMKKMGEYGFLGVLVPEELGGAGFGYDEYITIIEEISKIDPSIGLSVAAHNSLCTNHILTFGSKEQKEKYIPDLATGSHIGAWALTEPNTGSDAMRMQCTAKSDGEHWILNGTKSWITHGKSGEIAVVIARTGELLDSNGMTAFILERGTPGFTSGKKENKLGMRASETAEIILEDCRVHKSQILGEVGAGFRQAMKILDGGRISIAALSLGLAKGAFEASLDYAKQREQFGQPIIEFQGIGFRLAELATKIEAAELLTRKAGTLKNKGQKVTLESAMAKLYASEVCVEMANQAVQIFGGNGFTKEFPVEKYYRDCKLCTIGEGTSEIQKLVISRQLTR